MNPPPPEKNRRVLIIDDNRSIHDDFRKILAPADAPAAISNAAEAALFGGVMPEIRQTKFEVDSAYQGQEGIQMATAALAAGRPYALAFVDVRMPPGWDGVETISRMWKLDPGIQVVLCTAYSDYSWSEMDEKLGQQDGLLILKKPFDSVEALQMTHALTEKWWLHRQFRLKMEELEERVAERTRELQENNQVLYRQKAELLESRRFLQATLDALSAHIAILDEQGSVVEVNLAWKNFARDNHSRGSRCGVGDNYLKICDQRSGGFSGEGETVARGIRAVMSGEKVEFDLEYPCHSPAEQRWYVIRVTRFGGEGPVRVVVAHENVTGRKRTEESLRLLGSAVEQSGESILITDAELDLPGAKIVFVNPAFTRMNDYTAAEVLGKSPLLLEGPHTNPALLLRLRRTLERGEVFAGETSSHRKDGTEFSLEWQIAPLRDAGGKITHFMAIQRDITARKLADKALRESNEKFVQLADNIADAFWIRSADLREVHYVSPAFERIWGRSVAYLHAYPQQWTDFVLSEDRERVNAAFVALTGQTVSIDLEYRIVRPDAAVRWVRVRGFQVRDGAGRLVRLTGIATDVTDYKRLQDQLVQSQKLESVGKLAGGVAHEFNSILTAIIGQSELLLGDLPAGSGLAGHATEIRQAADRAAVLTRQLLAYGRKQRLETVVLDLNRLVAGMEEVFRPLVGSTVNTEIIAAPGLRQVKADAEQIEHVILSLVVNAGEAMPNGGKLTLETANIAFRPDSVGRPPDLKPGDYVVLAITDTGVGMTAEVQARLFEPFFTTKGATLGAGLSLSTCYGIIKQSGGHISVHSEPGRGTTFKVFLPQVESVADSAPRRIDSPDLPRGTETILLVEADPALRGMATALLGRLGYTVLAAADGMEALGLHNQRGAGPIDLLFTDLVMPHLSGTELADQVQASFPHLRVLFTSAYPDQAVALHGVPQQRVALLQKPFTPSALARKLREVLDRAAEPPGATESSGLRPSG